MDTQTEAQIYLSDQRGFSQLDSFRSYHSFNFGHYFQESRKPFGALQLLNDDTLKAGKSIRMIAETHTTALIIPIVGGLEYKSESGDGFLEAGEVQIFSLAAGMDYELINPYETELINFIQVWLDDDSIPPTSSPQQTAFDLTTKNKLLPILPLSSSHTQISRCYIGRYDGRQEDVYHLQQAADQVQSTGIFVFILSGAFEVQNRLLHERDGLALTNLKEGVLEFEALSNDAILLLMEIPIRPEIHPV
ncbi:pirin family protein [Spirosoma endbachense]|uniref:Pirin n=1 Tax=Spirosoma endbachense TaxID=2666025 RepID=A0A6P1W3N1_9BACT|nr:pirin family protein [Spirosoma endbachense]QHV98609.1 pirin [Spirosoma endbachense]